MAEPSCIEYQRRSQTFSKYVADLEAKERKSAVERKSLNQAMKTFNRRNNDLNWSGLKRAEPDLTALRPSRLTRTNNSVAKQPDL